MLKRLKLAIAVLFGSPLPVNSACVTHQGFTSVPDQAAEAAHMWSLVEEAHQQHKGSEANELIDVLMNGNMTNLEFFTEIYELLGIQIDWPQKMLQVTLYGTAGTGKTYAVSSS